MEGIPDEDGDGMSFSTIVWGFLGPQYSSLKLYFFFFVPLNFFNTEDEGPAKKQKIEPVLNLASLLPPPGFIPQPALFTPPVPGFGQMYSPPSPPPSPSPPFCGGAMGKWMLLSKREGSRTCAGGR